MEELTEEQMLEMSLDELQLMIEGMNKGKLIDTEEFNNFQYIDPRVVNNIDEL